VLTLTRHTDDEFLKQLLAAGASFPGTVSEAATHPTRFSLTGSGVGNINTPLVAKELPRLN